MPAPWHNRIVGYGEEAPDQLLANPRNWRIHPRHQQDALSGVLREVGVVQNVIVNQQSGFVVDGHLRVALALRDGQPSIPVTYVDLSDAEEALILATLDPIGALAATDAAKFDALLREVTTGEAAVQELLASLGDAAGLLTIPDPAPQDEPTLPSECFVEIYCARDDLAAFRATLTDWGARPSVTINIQE